jgi:hypothetical protein
MCASFHATHQQQYKEDIDLPWYPIQWLKAHIGGAIVAGSNTAVWQVVTLLCGR